MAFPGVYSFSYYKGDTFQFVIRPKNSDGSAFDLSDFDQALFTIATTRGAATSIAALATIDISTDIITCTIPSNTGATLSAAQYVYDVEITDTATNPDIVYTLLTGVISVTEQVSGA